jgi:hypothetical protein
MKTTLLDRIFGNCEKGVHKFNKFLIKETPPTNLTSFRATYTSDAINIIDSLTKREYEIRCKHCGKKLEE